MTLNNALTASAPATDAPSASDEGPADSGYGWVMLVAFTSSVLAITFTVCVLALVGSWWMLGVAMAAHIAVTGSVMKVVLGAFGSEAYPEFEHTELVPESLPAQIQLAPMEARRASLAVDH